jgi:hypothetical protein
MVSWLTMSSLVDLLAPIYRGKISHAVSKFDIVFPSASRSPLAPYSKTRRAEQYCTVRAWIIEDIALPVTQLSRDRQSLALLLWDCPGVLPGWNVPATVACLREKHSFWEDMSPAGAPKRRIVEVGQ